LANIKESINDILAKPGDPKRLNIFLKK